MYFSVDYDKKIIFGWSAKCGCTHIKAIIRFLQKNEIYTKDNEMRVHDYAYINEIPNDIENYITIIFTRNPYKRVISGFLNKYRINGEYRVAWKDKIVTFSAFIDKIINYEWHII